MRKLIDTGFAQDTTNRRDPRIVFDLEDRPLGFVELFQFLLLFFGIRDHGAEFHHFEMPPIVPHTRLDKKHRPVRGGDFDQDRRQEEQRRQHQQ